MHNQQPMAALCGGCGGVAVPGLLCCPMQARAAARAKRATQVAKRAPSSRPSGPMPMALPSPSVPKPRQGHPTQQPHASQQWRTHANHTSLVGQYTRGIARTQTLLRK